MNTYPSRYAAKQAAKRFIWRGDTYIKSFVIRSESPRHFYPHFYVVLPADAKTLTERGMSFEVVS